MKHVSIATLALSALLSLAACGGAADPKSEANAGQSALSKGNHADAKAHFDAVLAAVEPSDPLFTQASVGSMRAEAHTDAESAQKRFLQFAKEHSDHLALADYTGMVSDLVSANAIALAVFVADSAKKTYPQHADKLDEMMAMLEAKAIAAAENGDNSGYEALKGLGYVGGGD